MRAMTLIGEPTLPPRRRRFRRHYDFGGLRRCQIRLTLVLSHLGEKTLEDTFLYLRNIGTKQLACGAWVEPLQDTSMPFAASPRKTR